MTGTGTVNNGAPWLQPLAEQDVEPCSMNPCSRPGGHNATAEVFDGDDISQGIFCPVDALRTVRALEAESP